jgi:uncharacterized protein (DUF305 family)
MKALLDRKTTILLAIIALLAAAVVSLSLNRSDDPKSLNSGSSYSGHSSTNENYTGADVMFLQMMIPHHQQAIDISNLAMENSQDSELLKLAQIISRDQAAEITQMKAWLVDAGASEDMGHSMDGMGGMLNGAELEALAAAKGVEFDRLWLKGMTEHHDGAIHMTQMIEDAQNPEIKAFGSKVIADQSAQIAQMKEMLKRIK